MELMVKLWSYNQDQETNGPSLDERDSDLNSMTINYTDTPAKKTRATGRCNHSIGRHGFS